MSKQRKSASKAPAKGKADKLITNAESPAAECSRPMPPHGKGRTGVAQSVFSAIAEQLRAIPGRTDRILDAENTAGRLLAEALKHGAFARIKHTHLRTWIDERIEKGLYCSAFGSAVNWFREYEPHWPAVAAWQNVGSYSHVKNGCPLLADVLEAEADVPEGERVLTPPVPGRLEVVAKAEELQRRQEHARQSEQHLRRLGVVYGRRGVILGGQAPAADAAAQADMPDYNTTLETFMGNFCAPRRPELIKRWAKQLRDAHKNKTCLLPPYVGKPKKGQRHAHNSAELMKAWPRLRDHIPELPPLKQFTSKTISTVK